MRAQRASRNLGPHERTSEQRFHRRQGNLSDEKRRIHRHRCFGHQIVAIRRQTRDSSRYAGRDRAKTRRRKRKRFASATDAQRAPVQHRPFGRQRRSRTQKPPHLAGQRGGDVFPRQG